MTASRSLKMRNPCNSVRPCRANAAVGLPSIATLAVLATLTLNAAQAADDLPKENLHVIDSSHDRTPAVTAIPTYPSVARRDRIEGDATVCFRVDVKGKIRSVRVKDYSARIFRRPALRAIKDSLFEPLQPNEVLSRSRTCRTYRFRLEPVLAATDKK